SRSRCSSRTSSPTSTTSRTGTRRTAPRTRPRSPSRSPNCSCAPSGGAMTETTETMRAWQVTAHGEPEQVMEVREVAVPAPGPGEVLVRVRAVAVNFPDVLLARGRYQERPELPFTPGIELCGEVAALGEGVTGLSE